MKRLTAILVLCALLSGCAGSPFSPVRERTPPADAQFAADIYPSITMSSGDVQTATAYFRLRNEDILVSAQFSFELAFGQTVEEAVIRRMLEGPGDLRDLTSLFPNDMQLIEVNEKSGYLEVVLSRDLNSPQGDKAIEVNNRLAVYSIVNAVTDLGRHSRVMFMVMDKSGSAVRMTQESAGIRPAVAGEQNLMEPLARYADVILTPAMAANLVLSAMSSQSVESVDIIRRFSLTGGGATPDEGAVAADLFGESAISDYSIKGEPIISPDGQSALALVDYDSLSAGQKHTAHTDVPLRLVRDQSGIWKVDYESLCALKAVNS